MGCTTPGDAGGGAILTTARSTSSSSRIAATKKRDGELEAKANQMPAKSELLELTWKTVGTAVRRSALLSRCWLYSALLSRATRARELFSSRPLLSAVCCLPGLAGPGTWADRGRLGPVAAACCLPAADGSAAQLGLTSTCTVDLQGVYATIGHFMPSQPRDILQ